MNIGVESLRKNYDDFRSPVGVAMNMSRACFGHFEGILQIVTLNNIINSI